MCPGMMYITIRTEETGHVLLEFPKFSLFSPGVVYVFHSPYKY